MIIPVFKTPGESQLLIQLMDFNPPIPQELEIPSQGFQRNFPYKSHKNQKNIGLIKGLLTIGFP